MTQSYREQRAKELAKCTTTTCYGCFDSEHLSKEKIASLQISKEVELLREITEFLIGKVGYDETDEVFDFLDQKIKERE
jgi:hypothetical protein